MEGRELQLSDLPEPILIHILSKLSDGKEVVRSSVLSTQWRFLWKSVPVSVSFCIPDDRSEKEVSDIVASWNRELYYWRLCEKIQTFSITSSASFVADVDMLVQFATKEGNVEEFKLECSDYEFPQFAYESTSLRKLVLLQCELYPSSSVNWNNLVSLSMLRLNLTDGVMEKVLCGCPNLECLKLDCWGFDRLEINSLKLREFIIHLESWCREDAVSLEISAPRLQKMHLSGYVGKIQLKNVTSLVTAELDIRFAFQGFEEILRDREDRLEEELIKFKGLLQSVAHIKNLELGSWCIEYLSILELKGWQFPPSGWKFLKLHAALEELDLPGICSYLQSSAVLETLVVDWSSHFRSDFLLRYTTDDEQRRRFEALNFNISPLHLKVIKFVNICGLKGNKSLLPLAKYLLKNAVVLEKFIIGAISSEVQDYARMKKKLLSYPRFSLHASLVFSFGYWKFSF